MKLLEVVSRAIINVLVFIISKTIVFLWTLHRCIFGYPPQRQQLPSDSDLARYEENSVPLGTIRLLRQETPFETFVYGHCINDDWDLIVKGVLHERKDSGENDFYLYTDNPANEMIEAMRMPAPITISFLDNVWRSEAD